MTPPATDYYIHTTKGVWEVVIGLEVHAQLLSRAKLFSHASTAYGSAPNTQVSFVDAAMPGMLPVLNKHCVTQAIKTGLALHAKINLYSEFVRKNYFYPDLPSGYQISQFMHPIVGEGYLDIATAEGDKRIGIERLHLEQDAGKMLHDKHPTYSLVDLNRAGVALMEIVSKPDMRSASEAQSYMRSLRDLLRELGTCDGNMEEGSLRADINVSVRPVESKKLGTRCEIKNINSFRFIGEAITYEAQRQIALLEEGGRVEQETRLFDSHTRETRSMRGKEDAHDYRYFPDPDLPPLIVSQDWVDEIRASLPEHGAERLQRFQKDYGLNDYDTQTLLADSDKASYFESALKALPKDASARGELTPKQVANWVLGDVSASLNEAGQNFADCPVPPESLSDLLVLLGTGVISGRIAKDVWAEMFATGQKAQTIVEGKGLSQVSDEIAIADIVDALIAAHPDKWAQIKDKPKALGWFVGQVMQQMDGKANPKTVNALLQKRL